jgi:hypothetical protein
MIERLDRHAASPRRHGHRQQRHLAPHFGLGEAGGEVDHEAALVTLTLVQIVVIAEILADSR